MENKCDFIEIFESETESSELERCGEDVVEISSSSSCDDDGKDCDYDDACDCYEENDNSIDPVNRGDDAMTVDINDEELVYNKVTQIIRGKCSFKGLKLVECRMFLRKHGLRLSGTKEECVERIEEFCRLKDGNAEAYYPRSSFTINCTGDVCKGDVVMFSQKVSQPAGTMKKHQSGMGRRTVAGKIVKESYGAAKQQHTFTVEVLWSKGNKKLSPLFPLLVKGRNLYKLKTFRQRWKNEKERLEVLAEKHRRGAAARATRKSKMMVRTDKPTTSKGAKCRKKFHQLDYSETKEIIHQKGKTLVENCKRNPCQNSTSVQASGSRQTRDSRNPAYHWNHQNHIQIREPAHLPNNYPSQIHYHSQADVRGKGFDHFASDRPYFPDHVPESFTECQEFNRGRFIYPSANPYHSHANESRNMNRFHKPHEYHSFHPSYDRNGR